MKKLLLFLIVLTILTTKISADNILVFMDESQKDHLKAYGLTYWVLKNRPSSSEKIFWLLNYRCGSFLLPNTEAIIRKSKMMGVSISVINDRELNEIEMTMQQENMDKVELEKAPIVAVYAPPTNNPWDDAVTLALTYAEVPFEKVWDDKILKNGLANFDWLHLHHEDFTGQYDKFYQSFGHSPWYINRVSEYTKFARSLGYASVREEKNAVAKTLKTYVSNGGFLFVFGSGIS